MCTDRQEAKARQRQDWTCSPIQEHARISRVNNCFRFSKTTTATCTYSRNWGKQLVGSFAYFLPLVLRGRASPKQIARTTVWAQVEDDC